MAAYARIANLGNRQFLDATLMAKPRHLAHAPITEAVIDLQVEPHLGATFPELQQAFESLDFGFRRQSFVVSGTFGFVVNQDAEPQHSGKTEKIGLRLHSDDEKYVVLVRTSGLSISRLAPYEDWDTLVAQVRTLWELYLKRWKPLKVTRIATRYINNLRLPVARGQSFSDFIETLTQLPGDVPQGLGPFLQQFNCMDPDSEDRVRLSLAWDGQYENGRLPVILDIDVHRAREFDPTDSAIWTALSALRDLKNRCFFGTVTELTLKDYS